MAHGSGARARAKAKRLALKRARKAAQRALYEAWRNQGIKHYRSCLTFAANCAIVKEEQKDAS